MGHYDAMNLEFQRAKRLAERGEWPEAEDAYESARSKAALLGASSAAKEAADMRDVCAANARVRLEA